MRIGGVFGAVAVPGSGLREPASERFAAGSHRGAHRWGTAGGGALRRVMDLALGVKAKSEGKRKGRGEGEGCVREGGEKDEVEEGGGGVARGLDVPLRTAGSCETRPSPPAQQAHPFSPTNTKNGNTDTHRSPATLSLSPSLPLSLSHIQTKNLSDTATQSLITTILNTKPFRVRANPRPPLRRRTRPRSGIRRPRHLVVRAGCGAGARGVASRRFDGIRLPPPPRRAHALEHAGGPPRANGGGKVLIVSPSQHPLLGEGPGLGVKPPQHDPDLLPLPARYQGLHIRAQNPRVTSCSVIPWRAFEKRARNMRR